MRDVQHAVAAEAPFGALGPVNTLSNLTVDVHQPDPLVCKHQVLQEGASPKELVHKRIKLSVGHRLAHMASWPLAPERTISRPAICSVERGQDQFFQQVSLQLGRRAEYCARWQKVRVFYEVGPLSVSLVGIHFCDSNILFFHRIGTKHHFAER